MKRSVKPMTLALACLMGLPLTACQTTSETSSSTIERTAEDIEWEVTKRYCVALKPVRVPSEDYDASPESVRRALAKNAAAWVAVCPQ
jgi:outer membrane lipoprotein SlyB